jgi:Transglutaminase-like superfamily
VGHRDRDGVSAQAFERLAAAGNPPRGELLSVLGAAVDGRAVSGVVDFALDDLGRRLFGPSATPAAEAAGRLGELLSQDPRFAIDHGDPRALMLDWVLAQRVGHPLMLAVAMAEAGRRAGMRTGVFSSRHAWYAGVSDADGLWIVETVDRDLPHPEQLRRHCAHEIAWAALLGLEQSYLRCRDEARAARARRLRGILPTQHPGTAVGDPLALLWSDSV